LGGAGGGNGKPWNRLKILEHFKFVGELFHDPLALALFTNAKASF